MSDQLIHRSRPDDTASPPGFTTQRHVAIRPWNDPIVDDDGHDPRSRYVETFWLGVLGPTATWLIRRLAAELDQQPDGCELDLEVISRSMGLGFSPGRSSPFTKALQRCVMFGLAHPLPSGGLAVRRRLPRVAHRHLRRMPDELQRAHFLWDRDAIAPERLVRAHQLAMTMIEVGDDVANVEHQLIALGVNATTAEQVADNVQQLAARAPAS